MSVARAMRSTPGDGAAVVTAAADQRMDLGWMQIQNKGNSAVNVKLKFGTREIYDVLLEEKGIGVLPGLPPDLRRSGIGESLYVNLDGAVDVYVQIEYVLF